MRPALLLVLVTLAVFCHSAKASPCPAIEIAVIEFLYGSVEEYVKAVDPYTTDPIMEEAERQLKQCMDNSVENKHILAFLLSQMIREC